MKTLPLDSRKSQKRTYERKHFACFLRNPCFLLPTRANKAQTERQENCVVRAHTRSKESRLLCRTSQCSKYRVCAYTYITSESASSFVFLFLFFFLPGSCAPPLCAFAQVREKPRFVRQASVYSKRQPSVVKAGFFVEARGPDCTPRRRRYFIVTFLLFLFFRVFRVFSVLLGCSCLFNPEI